MPIASRRGSNNAPIKTKAPETTATVVTVDDAIINMSNYIRGHNWTIDYYSQVKGSADINIQQDQGAVTPQQHYTKIKGLRVNLRTPIDAGSIDSLNGVMLMSKVKPQVSDAFKAVLISGDTAVFRVTEVTAINYSIDTHYEVSFVLDTTDILDPQRVADLDSSTTTNLEYNTNSIHSQSSAILVPSAVELVKELENYVFKNTGYYIDTFVDNTISLELTNGRLYCPSVEQLVFSFLTSEKLIYTNARAIEGSILVNYLATNSRFKQTYFKDISKGSITDYNIRMRIVLPSNVKSLTVETDEQGSSSIPTFNSWLYDGSEDNPYFLYSPDSNSQLSKLINKYVEEEEIEDDEIIELINQTLSEEEEYYFLPILIMLVNYKLSKMYNS